MVTALTSMRWSSRTNTLLENLLPEVNPVRKALYQLCWHLGGSQGDIASLKGEDVDWTQGRCITRLPSMRQH